MAAWGFSITIVGPSASTTLRPEKVFYSPNNLGSIAEPSKIFYKNKARKIIYFGESGINTAGQYAIVFENPNVVFPASSVTIKINNETLTLTYDASRGIFFGNANTSMCQYVWGHDNIDVQVTINE